MTEGRQRSDSDVARGTDADPKGGPLKLQPTPQTVKGNSGETVTIRFMLLNRSETTLSHAPVIDVDPLPGEMSIAQRDDFQGTWRASTKEWFWRALAPEEKVLPTLTIEIPEETEAGEYTLSAYAHDWNENDATGSVRIHVDPSKGKGKKKGKGKDNGRGDEKGRGDERGKGGEKGNGKKDNGGDRDNETDEETDNGEKNGGSTNEDNGKSNGEKRGNGGGNGKGKNDSKGAGAIDGLVSWFPDVDLPDSLRFLSR